MSSEDLSKCLIADFPPIKAHKQAMALFLLVLAYQIASTICTWLMPSTVGGLNNLPFKIVFLILDLLMLGAVGFLGYKAEKGGDRWSRYMGTAVLAHAVLMVFLIIRQDKQPGPWTYAVLGAAGSLNAAMVLLTAVSYKNLMSANHPTKKANADDAADRRSLAGERFIKFRL